MIRRTSSATEMLFSFAIFSNAFRKIDVRILILYNIHLCPKLLHYFVRTIIIHINRIVRLKSRGIMSCGQRI